MNLTASHQGRRADPCPIESYRQGDVLIFRDRGAKTPKEKRTTVPVVTYPSLDIGDEARGIVSRLATVNRASPSIDRPAVEQAIQKHLAALDLPVMPVRWVEDATAAYAAVYQKALLAASAAWSAAESAAWSAARSAAESAAWSAARSAARSAAWSAAWSAAEKQALDRICGVWLPLADAFTAGLWLFWICEDEVIAVPRPAIHVDGERLHRADGPAVEWPNGSSYYFWKGLQVPKDIILEPEKITTSRIDGERNAEVRRVLLDRFGVDRYMLDTGAEVIHGDRFGKLLRKSMADDEPLLMVQVVNSTPEPDGKGKIYMLRVHPELRPMLDGGQFGDPQQLTARNAVASTFGLRGEQYDPVMET